MMICLPITEVSEVAHARRTATELARRLGFTELEIGKVALVTTEVATNLSKHAISGQLFT
jgi:anti-sigma regulatory factor (Ser/Thr protein kinase)